MQSELLDVAGELVGESDLRDRLAVAVADLAHDPPARTEAQMRFLRRRDPLLGVGQPQIAATAFDLVDVDRLRGLHRMQQQPRLGVRLPAARAVVEHALALHLKLVALDAATQPHAHRPALAIRHVQRAEEVQVAQLERAVLADRRQALGGHLQVAGARHQRVAFLGAVLVEQPRRLARHRAADQRLFAADLHELVEQRLFDGLRAAAAAIRRAVVGRRHADAVPDAPLHGDGRFAVRGALAGERVEERVGADVVDLAGRAEHRTGRREQHREVLRLLAEHFFEHERTLHLGCHDAFDGRLLLLRDQLVLDRAGGVEHAVDRAEALAGLAHDRLHLHDVGDVRGAGQHLGAERLEQAHLLDRARGPVVVAEREVVVPAVARRQFAATDQHQAGPARACEPLGTQSADAAEAAGDQVDTLLAQLRRQAFAGNRQLLVDVLEAEAAVVAQREHAAVLGRQLRLDRAHQSIERFAALAAAGALGQPHVDESRRDTLQFARHHQARAEHRRLLRAVVAAVGADRLVGQHDDAQPVRQLLAAERLREEEQAEEAVLLAAVEEARSRAEAAVGRQQPRVHDAAHLFAVRGEVGEQRVVALAAHLRGERVLVVRDAAEGVAEVYFDHVDFALAQARDDASADARAVDEYDPRAARDRRLGGVFVIAAGPARQPLPLCDVVDALARRRCVGRGTFALRVGFDPVALVAEGVRRQRQPRPVARHDVRERQLDASGPQACERAGEVVAIVDLLVRVTIPAVIPPKASPLKFEKKCFIE